MMCVCVCLNRLRGELSFCLDTHEGLAFKDNLILKSDICVHFKTDGGHRI